MLTTKDIKRKKILIVGLYANVNIFKIILLWDFIEFKNYKIP